MTHEMPYGIVNQLADQVGAMASYKDILGYSLVVSVVDLGAYCQGVVHIFSPDRSHLRTIETSVRHATLEDAEAMATQLGEEYVRSLRAPQRRRATG